MATIRKILELDIPAAKAWEALADFQNVHTRLAPGFRCWPTLTPSGSVSNRSGRF